MKKLILLVIAWISVFATVYGQMGVQPLGAGTSSDPYQVATWQNLYWISQNNTSWDKHFLQTADIDFSLASPAINTWSGNTGWTPIGLDLDNPFTGVYDGGGFKIKGVFIDRSANIQALFGRVQGPDALIVNTHVRSSNVSAGQDVGLLVAVLAGDGKVFYCSSEGSVNATNSRSGGLVGYNLLGIIEHSYTNATVTGTDRAGTLVGQMWIGSRLSRSKAVGNVSGTSGTGGNGVGGFVGFITSTTTIIEDCYNNADVTALSNTASHRFAAFLGYSNLLNSQVRRNYSTGSVNNFTAQTNRGFFFRDTYSNFVNNFWLSEQSNQTTAVNASELTNLQARNQASYSSWDFVGESANGTEDIWVIQTGVNDGFPYLYWEDLDMSHCRVSVGGTCYTTLKAAFDAINAGTHNGDILVRINQSTTETATAVLQASGVGPASYTRVVIHPAKNEVVISGNLSGYVIDIRNATNAKIDGRVMGEGIAAILKVENTGTGCAIHARYYDVIYTQSNPLFYGGTIAVEPQQVSGVYQIASFQNLFWISVNPSSWSSNFTQTADIDAALSIDDCLDNANGWEPIGNSTNRFTGTYNGNGHTISNLFINRPASSAIGLFGSAENATIQNLGLLNVNISGQNQVGGLAGVIQNTTVSQVFVSGGTVTGDNETGFVGGLIGRSFTGSSISNVYSIVQVINIDAFGAAGGLVGQYDSQTITNAYVAGQVNASSAFSFLRRAIGQQSGSSCTNCFFDNTVNSDVSAGQGQGRSTAQMQQQATFTSWDFQCEAANGSSDVWGIDEGNEYPVLSVFGFNQTCSYTPAGSITITNGSSSPSADWVLYQGKLIPLQNNPSVNVNVVSDYLKNNGDLIVEAPVDVTLNATLSTELSSARTLTLRSGRDIRQGQSISIASSGAPLNLIFWSDVDGNGGGSIWIRRDASINTNGGHLWMGGGSGTETWNELSVGNGFAQARTVIPSNEILQLSLQNDAHQDGVIIERSSIVTGNGDVYIKGRVSGLTSGESSGYGQIGVYILRGSAITTTNGNITILGITESTKTSSSWFWGVLLGSDRATEPNRIETTSGSIYIEGNASQTANQNHSGGFGIFEWANLTRGINEIKTHSGDIILRGHNKNTTTNSYGGLVGLNGEINSKRFISQSGNISLHGISDDPTKNGINISSGFRVGYDGTHPYSGNIAIRSNRINALPSGTTIRSTGNLQIIPHDNHTTIGIAGASGTLALPESYFSTYFDADFSNIVIGSENQSGSIAVNGFNLAHHMTMQTSSTLTLGGKPVLGAYNLTLGKDITNVAGSPTHYFQTNSTGQVVREIPTLEQGFFPVGNAHYNPVTITNKTGSSDQFSVRVMDDVLLEGLTGPSISTPHVKVTWDIDKQQANDETGIDFEFQWGLDQENGGISAFRLNHHNGSNWEFAEGTSQTTIAGSRKTMVHTGYTGSFSPFALGDPNAVLPVTLMSFEANCFGEDVLLQWTTASEFNNDFFMVYGSSDAINWTVLKRIAGNGTTNIPQRYQTALSGSAYQYFRLLQQDYDGTNEWLPIVRADCDKARVISAHPNPFDSRIIFSGLDANASYNLKVYRENGQLLAHYDQVQSEEISTLHWPTGIYLLVLQSGRGELSYFKLFRK
jgi:hypothetical protein